MILFSFIWSFGSLMKTEPNNDRAKYNKLLIEIVKGKTDINEEYKLYLSEDQWTLDESICTKMDVQED